VILLSAQGRPFTQAVARELAALERVVLICGRYEGVDERINQLYCDLELSIGDYVLSGGELAAAVVVDAVMRLIPGVLGNEPGRVRELRRGRRRDRHRRGRRSPSQHGRAAARLPHYTRPAEFAGCARRSAPQTRPPADSPLAREQQLRKTLATDPIC